jgi:hypothetical protein
MDVVSGFSVPPKPPRPRDMSPAERKAHDQRLAAARQRKRRKLLQKRAADANSVEQPAVANQQVMAEQGAARGGPAEEQANLQQLL